MKKTFFAMFFAVIVIFIGTIDIVASTINNSIQFNDSIPPPQLDSSTASQGMVDDYIVMSTGKMLFVNGKNVKTLTQAMILKNGTIIKPDGTIQPKDETMFLLKDGQRIYIANGRVSGNKITDVN